MTWPGIDIGTSNVVVALGFVFGMAQSQAIADAGGVAHASEPPVRVYQYPKRNKGLVLPALWNRLQASGEVAASLAGPGLLAAAEDAFNDRLGAMVEQAENAIALARRGDRLIKSVAPSAPLIRRTPEPRRP